MCDGLNNGAKGTVRDFIRRENIITHVLVEFENKEAGEKMRQNQPDTFSCLYENCTPISRLSFTYSISKRQMQEGQKAICIQFPLQLGYAMTIHKIQGGTIYHPNSRTSNFEGIFDGSQAYTVLSRIKQLD